jgi:NhaP-type Na+/H+ or K+/H+ antiporter
MLGETLALTALAVFTYGLVSRRAERSVVTPPMAFVLLGLTAGLVWLKPSAVAVEEGVLRLLAEVTLVLILFTDASRIDLRILMRERGLPVRLLLFGLPLTIAAGTGVAVAIYPAFTLFTAAVLATTLAPTDAALGQAVVGNKGVPQRIRQSLNVESGLNDGLVLPALLIFMSACAVGHSESTGYWVRFALLQVTLGPVVGVAVGFIGGKLVERMSSTGWMNETFQQISSLSLSVLAYGAAEVVGGNGFIAAFVAGLTLGNSARRICGCLYEFGETEGQLLSLLVFLAFGAVLLPPAVEAAEPRDWLYAALSLTAVRMIPVAVSLVGAGLRSVSVVFLGWFGPRGLASILFALLVLEDRMVLEAEPVARVAYLTVLLSVLAHGLTAYPLSEAFGRVMQNADPDEPERHPVGEMPTRLG